MKTTTLYQVIQDAESFLVRAKDFAEEIITTHTGDVLGPEKKHAMVLELSETLMHRLIDLQQGR